MTNKEWEQMNLSDKINRFNRRVVIPMIIVVGLVLSTAVIYASMKADPGKSGALILAR